jgi:acetylornithine deacetylase/succinyl-diaminopimelate desuccinylase-like protein
MPPPEQQRLAREIYKELIETNTSYSTGATTPAAQAVAARLRASGFPETDIEVVGAAPNKMNVVARYRGTGVRPPILLLAHLDVVEALRADWSMDPFQLTERDGYFYGRGTGDDKAQAAIWVASFIRYKQEGFRPDRDLILALTADEEGGGPFNGVQWLLKNRPEIIKAEFCLNEGGWGEIRNGKNLLNSLQVSEKYVANFRLEVKNKGGHSSMPVKENAIYRLAGALQRLALFEFPIKLNEVTRGYFEQTAKLESGSIAEDLRAAAEGSAAAQNRVAAASPAWNAVMRTTCVATKLDGGHAYNALPQTAGAVVNCRILPGQAVEDVQQTLKGVIADDQVSLSLIGEPPHPSPPSPLRPDLMKAVSELTNSMWPGVPAIPKMVMGGTDGMYLRAAGIPTYGVQGIFFDSEDIRFHGKDERLGVKQFYEGQTFLYELVKLLSH